MNPLKRPLYILSFFFLWGLLTANQQPARAQITQQAAREDALVRLSRREARTFDSAFQTLAAQARVAFVAEGAPRNRTLDDKQLQGIPAEAPLDEMVNKLADAYDYVVERRRSTSIFILKKRYTDPADLPGVTLEEGRLALRDVLRILSRHHRKTDSSRLLRDLAASLTQDQLRQMRGRREGTGIRSPFPKSQALPLTALSARQRALVWQFTTYFYVQRKAQWADAIASEMDALLVDGAAFGWSSQYGDRAFGYETPNKSQGAPIGAVRFWPLSSRMVTAMVVKKSDASARRIPGYMTPLQKEAEKPDPTAPTPPTDIASPAAREAAAPSTLQSVVARLNARPGSGDTRMAVDDALADKPVTVFGTESAAPGQILDALAAVYGLRVKVQEDDGTLLLTRRLPRMAPRITDLPDTVRHSYPEPLLRAFLADARDRFDAEEREQDLRRQQPREEAAPPTDAAAYWAAERQRSAERHDRQMQLSRRGGAVRIAAMQRLRTLIEPKVKDAPTGRVPLSSLGGEERMALAVLLLADTWTQMNEVLRRPAPEWIADFDRLYIVGGLTEQEGKQFFSLFLASLLPDGKRAGIIGPGTARVPYPKQLLRSSGKPD